MTHRATPSTWPLRLALFALVGCGASETPGSPRDAAIPAPVDRGAGAPPDRDARPADPTARAPDAASLDAGVVADRRSMEADLPPLDARRPAHDPDPDAHDPARVDMAADLAAPNPAADARLATDLAADAPAPPPPDAAPAPDLPPPPRFHAEGYDEPEVHGPELRLGLVDCRPCHGEALEGARGVPGCDRCHAPDWRTDCVFCHGGTDTDTGAPPRDLDGLSDREHMSFPAHTAHTTESTHPAYDCTQCHRKPVDALDAGHVFDATPGAVEIDFSGGLGPAGAYPQRGRCNSIYCHGNGAFPGDASLAAPPPTCESCHPTGRLLGPHGRHVGGAGIGCEACHAMTVAPGPVVIAPSLHVNGRVEVALAEPGLVFEPGLCNGICHDHAHARSPW